MFYAFLGTLTYYKKTSEISPIWEINSYFLIRCNIARFIYKNAFCCSRLEPLAFAAIARQQVRLTKRRAFRWKLIKTLIGDGVISPEPRNASAIAGKGWEIAHFTYDARDAVKSSATRRRCFFCSGNKILTNCCKNVGYAALVPAIAEVARTKPF